MSLYYHKQNATLHATTAQAPSTTNALLIADMETIMSQTAFVYAIQAAMKQLRGNAMVHISLGCNSRCAQCTGGTKYDCTQCPTSFTLMNGQCLCAQGYYELDHYCFSAFVSRMQRIVPYM